MRNFTLLILAIFLFSGCDRPKDIGTDSSGWYNKRCIDDVVYIKGYGGFSPWINPKTLTFENCKLDERKK